LLSLLRVLDILYYLRCALRIGNLLVVLGGRRRLRGSFLLLTNPL